MRVQRSVVAGIGWSLIGAALLVMGGIEHGLRRDGQWAGALLASPEASPEARANASYHLAHVERQRRSRWHLTGHGTLAILAGVSGIVMVAGTRRRGSTASDV